MSHTASEQLSVLTRNLYLGADFLELFPCTTQKPLKEIAERFFEQVKDTDYHERACSLADEFVRLRPHVACLQEVYRYRISGTGPEPATDLDFLAILQAELEARDASYRVVCETPATSLKLPIRWEGHDRQLEIQDRIAILVRSGVDAERVASGTYEEDTVSLPLPNEKHPERRTLDVYRPYAWARVDWRGGAIHVLNTHLESITEDCRSKQARKLEAMLRNVNAPVVLAGDLNATPDDPAYKVLRDAARFGDPFTGNDWKTYGAKADLRDDPLVLTQRLDHILTRGIRAAGTELFGARPEERTRSGLWPSDHAGIMLRCSP